MQVVSDALIWTGLPFWRGRFCSWFLDKYWILGKVPSQFLCLDKDLFDDVLEFFSLLLPLLLKVGLDDFIQTDLTWVSHFLLLSSRMFRRELHIDTWQIYSMSLSIFAKPNFLSSPVCISLSILCGLEVLSPDNFRLSWTISRCGCWCSSPFWTPFERIWQTRFKFSSLHLQPFLVFRL